MGTETSIIIKILGNHLNELSKARLEDFIVALCGLQAPRGCNQIQIDRLKGRTPMDVADIIINSYTVKHGPVKVREALRNINENQIRVDLEKDLRGGKNEKKNPKEAEPAPRTSGGRVSAEEPEKIIKAGYRPKMTVPVQPTGADTECEPGTSQQTEEIKPKRGRKPKTAPRTSGGRVSAEEPENITGAGDSPKPAMTIQTTGTDTGCESGTQPGEEIKPKRGRKPKTEPKTMEKTPMKEQTSGGAEGGKRAREEAREEDEKPKRATPRTSGGRVSAEELEKITGAGESPKPAVTVQPKGAYTECEPGTSQQTEEIKPKRGRKPKTEPKTTEKSPVKAQTSGGAAGGKRARKEPREEDEKPKTANKNNFVNENRNNLIKLITQVDPVLDDLLEEGLLTQEQYDSIWKKGSSQERMRLLLDSVDHDENDKFLPILEKHYPSVIKTLKKKFNLEK
ncbi:uncharacterized protein [Dendrobates tinctorius]|uniref:uncharacterized protein isoform X2 n=1 Tax=Dendrobates tinctorius TaxID=92724 RepID=UPI003CC9F6EB